MITARTAVVTLSLALSFCAAQQPHAPNTSARRSYDQAMIYLNQGKWQQAGTRFKQALDSDLLYCEAHEKYQDVEYYYFERRDKAFAEYADLVKRYPQNPLFHYLIARVSSQRQRDSLRIFKSPIALDSSFVLEYKRLLPILFYQGKLDEADALVEAGLRYSPNNIDLLLLRGQLYTKQGKADESSDVLRKIVQLYPNSETTLFAYIELASRATTDTEKMQLLEDAVRVDTSAIRGDAFSNLFELYAKTDPARAVKFARKALMTEQSYRDHRLSSMMYGSLYRLYIKSDTAKAIELAKEVSMLTIRDPRMYLTFGNLLLTLKREVALAIKLLEKGLRYHTPENIYGISSFGAMSQTAIRQNHKQSDAYFRLSLGSAYYQNMEYLRALSVLRSGLGKYDQADPDLYDKIGMTYEKLAKPREAMTAYLSSLSFRENTKVRSSLETLASRETNLKIAIPPKRVTDIDTAIARAQIPRAKKAPDFRLQNLQGVPLSLSSFRGKVLLLDFWATWCGPCVAELPKLQELFQKYEQNPSVRVVAISTDINDEDVKKFIDKHGYTFPVLMDKGAAALYGVQGIPALFVIDQTGSIRYRHEGYDPNVEFVSMLSKEIELILSTTNTR